MGIRASVAVSMGGLLAIACSGHTDRTAPSAASSASSATRSTVATASTSTSPVGRPDATAVPPTTSVPPTTVSPVYPIPSVPSELRVCNDSSDAEWGSERFRPSRYWIAPPPGWTVVSAAAGPNESSTAGAAAAGRSLVVDVDRDGNVIRALVIFGTPGPTAESTFPSDSVRIRGHDGSLTDAVDRGGPIAARLASWVERDLTSFSAIGYGLDDDAFVEVLDGLELDGVAVVAGPAGWIVAGSERRVRTGSESIILLAPAGAGPDGPSASFTIDDIVDTTGPNALRPSWTSPRDSPVGLRLSTAGSRRALIGPEAPDGSGWRTVDTSAAADHVPVHITGRGVGIAEMTRLARSAERVAPDDPRLDGVPMGAPDPDGVSYPPDRWCRPAT